MSAVAPLDRIDQLTRSPQPEATWWTALVQALDRLEERILEHRAGHPRLHDQLVADAPQLADLASSMDRELDVVGQRLREARTVVGEHVGDRSSIAEASRIAADVARRLRRWERKTSDLLHTAYQVDIGGE